MWLLCLFNAGAAEIVGTVRDELGTPEAGVSVVVYDRRLGYYYAQTDADGSYRVKRVPPGGYRVRVLPANTSESAETWLPEGSLSLCTADLIEVGEADQEHDIDLERGASIAGRLVDEAGDPVVGARVSTDPRQPVYSPINKYGFTGTDGRYEIVGIAPDQGSQAAVALRVEHPTLPDQYLPGVYGEANSDTVRLRKGQQRNIGEDTLLPGITVGGAVTGPDGPIDGGLAFVYAAGQVRTVDIVAGRYLAEGLPTGDVITWISAEGFAQTYLGDTGRPSRSVPVADEGDQRDDVDISAPYESRLVGQVLGSGDRSGVSLLAYNDENTVAIAGVVSRDGRFEVPGLSEGDWTLAARPGGGALLGHVSDFIRDERGDKQVFAVPYEGDERVRLSLPLGATFEGSAVDLYTREPLYGAFVHLEHEITGATATPMVGRDGTFSVGGLESGVWWVWADYFPYCDDDRSWVPRYYPDQVNPELVGVVSLRPGDVVRWDLEMAPDDDHDLMDDVWEKEHGIDPARDDADEDPDNDGFTNLEEYRLGTDPTSKAGRQRGCGCASYTSDMPAVPWLLLSLLFAPLLARAGEPPAAPAAPEGFTTMEVLGVHPAPPGFLVMLGEAVEAQVVPMSVGETEALSIHHRLTRRRFERPLTHDLLDSMVKELGGKVTDVRIDNLLSGTFVATITVTQGDKTFQVDSRASDAVALALGAGVPIYVSTTVVKRAGLPAADLLKALPLSEPSTPLKEKL